MPQRRQFLFRGDVLYEEEEEEEEEEDEDTPIHIKTETYTHMHIHIHICTCIQTYIHMVGISIGSRGILRMFTKC